MTGQNMEFFLSLASKDYFHTATTKRHSNRNNRPAEMQQDLHHYSNRDVFIYNLDH